MKNIRITKKPIIIVFLALVLGASACKEDTPEVPSPEPSYDTYSAEVLAKDPTAELKGDITKDQTLVSGKAYVLSGGVHVKKGAKLTIEPGVIIYSDVEEFQASGAVYYLMIERGAKIEAEGTADAPIAITSGNKSPQRGDWGGLIINGYAPINKGGGEATVEVGDALYGGDNPNDDSGILKYLRLEYTGNVINSEKEHNGLTFNGVGSGTVVEYVQVVYGKG